MNWMGLLAIVVATWCGIDIGIAITKKNTKDIIFNSIIVLFEWAYTL
jgi:uncharacterized protein YneF (UPF0154 family)